MSSFDFGTLYSATEAGAAPALPADTYDVEVADARFNEKNEEKPTIFLELRVLNGPQAGKIANVSLFFPEAGAKGFFYYQKKIAGFMNDRLKAAFTIASGASSVTEGFKVIAEALKGQTVRATIGVQDKEGPHKGSNELAATAPLEASAPAVAAAPVATTVTETVTAPAAAPVAAPAPADTGAQVVPF